MTPDQVFQPGRAAIVGHCPNPECTGALGGRVIVVLNDGGTWPLVECACGWQGPTDEIVNRVRMDQGWRVSDGSGPERELRP